jgi:copper(I)-binding protein
VAVIRSTSRAALAGLVVAGGLLLTGCGAGQVAQTAEQQGTVDGVGADIGSLSIRNAALEYPNGGFYDAGSTARLRMVITNQGTTTDTLTAVRSDAADEVTISDSSATASPGASESASPSDTASAAPSGSATPSGSASPSDTATPSDGASPSDTAAPSGSASASESATPSASLSPTPTQPAGSQVSIPPNGFVSFIGDGPSVQLVGLKSKLYPSQTVSVTLVFQRAGSVTLTVAVATPEGEVSPAPTVTGVEGAGSEG